MKKSPSKAPSSIRRAPSKLAVLFTAISLSLVGASCSSDTPTNKPEQTTSTAVPADGSVTKFRQALEEPAKDLSLKTLERLMGPGSTTERTVYDDSDGVRITNRRQTAGPDGEFATEDDPKIPEARFDVEVIDGVTYIVALAVQGNGPMADPKTQHALFEASFRVTNEESLDPARAGLSDIQNVLSDQGSTTLVGLNVWPYDHEMRDGRPACDAGLAVYDEGQISRSPTLGCATTVAYLGQLVEDQSSTLYQNPELRTLNPASAQADIAYALGQLKEAERDITSDW